MYHIIIIYYIYINISLYISYKYLITLYYLIIGYTYNFFIFIKKLLDTLLIFNLFQMKFYNYLKKLLIYS